MIPSEKLLKLFLDLLMENSSVSIETLINQSDPFGKIDYKPEYQREYVWDEIKATSYVESVIMGTEIPPKIFWYDDYNELIDGRQRYETLVKFVNNEFCLNEKGLYVLKNLKCKKFKDLDAKLQDYFMNTMVRTLLITMNTPSEWDEFLIDQIKKAIFRRYNMGLTPLSEVEIARAKYIDNDLTQYFIRCFKEDKKTFEKTALLFSNIKNKTFFDHVEILMAKIRLLLVVDKVKIDYFVTNKGKGYTKSVFDNLDSTSEYNKKVYSNFLEKINILYGIKSYFDLHKFTHYINLYETLYWALSVIEHENVPIDKCKDEKFCTALVHFVLENQTPMLIDNSEIVSQYMKNKLRYHNIAAFFEKYFEIDLSKYIVVTSEFRKYIEKFNNKNHNEEIVENIENLHLGCHEVKPYPIHEIIKLVKNGNIDLRPLYQRSENPDKNKASGIIESLLMKFKLLPIFVFVRKDNSREVIDGQQRLLAILGYLGIEYKNENGIFIKSNKNRFKLQDLKILEELNGKEYECENPDNCLSPIYRNMIRNTVIPVVEIHEAKHENFKPVDLFIRLNSRPFPVKNNSFEIWNTILPNKFLRNIKENTKKHEDWFYIKNKKRDPRMINEELYTIIMFLETGKSEITHINDKDIHHFGKKGYVAMRICHKSEISDFLYKVAREKTFENIKNNTEKFLEKLTVLLSDDIKCSNEFLEKELNKLIIISKKKNQRSRTILLALWYFISPIELSVIKSNSKQIKSDLKKLINYLTPSIKNLELADKIYVDFKNYYDKYRAKYYIKQGERMFKLNNDDVKKTVRENVHNAIKKKKRNIETPLNKHLVTKEKESTIVNVSINVQSDNSKMNN